ncbi:MAG: tetratricopeptide repeat protein [Betaproteobacteria bacterium]
MSGVAERQFDEAARQRIRRLLRDGRFDEAAIELDAELARIKGSASRQPAVRDVADATVRLGAVATAGTPDSRPSLSASRALALAHFAEAAGDGGIAAVLYTAVASTEGARVPALLGLGRVLHPLGRTAEAASALESAAAMQPASVEAWCNLSALQVELGRADAALDAAHRALLLQPDLGAALLNRGDAFRQLGQFIEAAEAYERAVALQPRWPVALNKLAGVRRILREYDRSEDLLRDAMAIAPQFGLARVNLGTLMIERGRYAEGRGLLEGALRLPQLDGAARAEAESALAMAGEHEYLAPAIAAAVAAADPEPLHRALDLRRDPADLPSQEVQALLAKMTARVLETRSHAGAPVEGETSPPEWPGIEAHFAFHRTDSIDELKRTLGELAKGSAVAGGGNVATSMLDVFNFERAVRERRARPMGEGTGSDVWLRYWHARVTAHRPEVFPGQMKPVPNLVLTSHRIVRAAPRQAAASCAAFFANEYPRLPPGFARATLVYFAITQIHPFFDGNGRIARFMQNAELELAGLHPLVIPQDVKGAIPDILHRVRTSADLGPLIAAMADAAEFTANVVRRLDKASGDSRGH